MGQGPAGRLAGRPVLITGAESGIGRAMAERCAAEGACVAIGALQADLGEGVAAVIREGGGRALCIPTDTRDQASLDDAIGRTVEEYGPLYGIVANAGITAVLTPFVDLEREDWDRVIATDLTGTFLALQAGARRLVAQGSGGCMIATGSSTAIRPGVGRIAYVAAKAGVHHMVKALALELAAHRIRVNGIAPGLTDTPTTLGKEGYIADGLRIVPLGETVDAEELGALAAFILSDDARHMTGSVVVLDAGRTAD